MTAPHIYTADEARALLVRARPGPWRVWAGGSLKVHAPIPEYGHGFESVVCWIDSCRGFPGDEIENPNCTDDGCEACRPVPNADAALLAAAPDLASTVLHLHDEVARLLAKNEDLKAALLSTAPQCDECTDPATWSVRDDVMWYACDRHRGALPEHGGLELQYADVLRSICGGGP